MELVYIFANFEIENENINVLIYITFKSLKV